MVRQTESSLHLISAFKDLETAYLRVTVAHNSRHLHQEVHEYQGFDQNGDEATWQRVKASLAM